VRGLGTLECLVNSVEVCNTENDNAQAARKYQNQPAHDAIKKAIECMVCELLRNKHQKGNAAHTSFSGAVS
jgi:hypothetical protein